MTARLSRLAEGRRSRRWMGVTAAASAGLMAIAALGASAGPAAADPTYVPAGTLTLQTGSVNRVTLDAASNGYDSTDPADLLETLSTSGSCGLSTGGASLLGFAGAVGSTSKPVGFLSGSIGVAEKSSGVSCYRVNGPTSKAQAESLTLSLGTALGTGAFRTVAKSVSLDLELKSNARVQAVATLGTAAAGTFEATAPDMGCSAASDDGPDAGARDNCVWTITPTGAFDKIKLTAVAGSFSLEGGADWPASTVTSTFELVTVADGILDCGDEVTKSGTSTTPTVTLDRLSDAGTTNCTKIPYTLSNSANAFQFLKPLGQPNAQFTFTVDWVSALPTPNVAQPPVTKVDFELGGGKIPLPWCINPTFDTNGVLTGVLDVSVLPDMDGVTTNSKQYACVATQVSKVVTYTSPTAPTLNVREQIYLLGDVSMGR
jgi:hypothetical protein